MFIENILFNSHYNVETNDWKGNEIQTKDYIHIYALMLQ
jgi:hypothetical protein